VLHGENLRDQVLSFLEDTCDAYITAETGDTFAEEWDLDKLWAAFKQLYPIQLTPSEVLEKVNGDKASLEDEELREAIKDDAFDRYDDRESALGEEVMRELERRVVLSVLDRKWREHLYEMDYLREGIGLRAMASRDPLVEYQREGFELFSAMMEAIREESIGYIFNVEVQVDEDQQVDETDVEHEHPVIMARGLEAPDRPTELHYSAPTIDGDQAEIHFDEHLDLDLSDDDDGGGYEARMSRAERRAARREQG
jgi:preprotein translocase subunit SecA